MNTCPACHSQNTTLHLAACPNLYDDTPESWDLLACQNCNLVFTSPVPDDLAKYYPEDYMPYNRADSPLRHSRLRALARKAILLPYILRYGDPDWQEKPSGNGKLLEVGPGSGLFLRRAGELGWQCWGIDNSRAALEASRKSAPTATLIQSGLGELELDEKFDLLVMSHVLEHLPDPEASLAKCRELLVPGGRLLLAVPNIGSWEGRLFGRSWRGLDLPRHLLHFNEKSLAGLLHRNGFEIIRMRGHLSMITFSDSLASLLPDRVRQKLLKGRAGRLLFYLLSFIATLSYLLGNRAALEVLARKTG